MYDCNIVVIDDDKIILKLIQVILEDVIVGNIHTFSDSKQALDYIKSEQMDKISLVICDWLMPDISGLDILAALRKSKPYCPFLLVTGNATKQLVVDSIRLGASEFIVKPFQSNNLISKVERLIRDADSE